MKLGESRTIRQLITLPEQPQESRQKELELFRENFDLILKNSDLIINKPRYFHSYLEASSIGLMHMGGHYAPLGALLQLWKNNEFIDKCDHCKGQLYLFHGGGSPLSGSNKCLGICRKCKTISRKSLPGVKSLVNALKHIKNNLNYQLIQQTKGEFFSFKDGLIGNPVPDKILEEGIIPVTITELISELQEFDKPGKLCQK